jgi:hypothetical protein
MNPLHVFFVLRARWTAALAVALVSFAIALGVGLTLPKPLAETSRWWIRSPDLVAALLGQHIAPAPQTQVDIIAARRARW